MTSIKISRTKFQEYHREVLQALTAIGNPTFGKAIQQDRGSQLKHLGIKFPELRRRVRQGFSFYSLPEEQVLEVWNALWQTSPYGDVLFAALEFYTPIVKKQVNPNLWSVVKLWSKRVDNWCHSDGLSNIYSRILESYPEEVYPQIVSWNHSKSEWLRRISLVSLIHYSGKNAVFLHPKKVLPLVSNCLDDERYYVQTAIGWVLREMGHVYKSEITKYIETHAEKMSSPAFSRAIEKMNSKERTQLRDLRKLRLAKHR
ncbi:MAG: DNA alkylation repair protein [Anaerolineales bacterium]|nr:DNA alkylation repair protein [Anaerolineales bacterium]